MTEHPFDPSASNLDGDQRDCLERLLAEYVERINVGEQIDPQEVIEAHPDLAADLLRELETVESIQAMSGVDSSGSALGTLGDYKLRRQIGRGGMGVVYDAWQNSVDRRVALKVLPTGVAADERALQRFIREAKTAAQLNHQNIVHVHGMGVEEDTPYFAMDFVDGQTLAQIIARIKNAQPETATVFGPKDSATYFDTLSRCFVDVADGLQHAHSKRVTHRDVKPSNLIRDSEGRLRILDFGLARLEGQESLTLSGDLVGTPLYMSPEQARQRKIQVDHRTDIYSLGATLYEMLTWRPPFKGKDHADTLSQIIERDPVEPRKLNPRVPKDLETIVLKCLRKNAADRYGTAEALGQDLRRFVRGDPIEARPQAKWEKAVRRAWRHRIRITALACGVLLLLASALLVRQQILERREADATSYRLLVEEGASRLLAHRIRSSGSAVTKGPVPGNYHDLLAARPGYHPVQRAADLLRKAALLRPKGVEAYYYLAEASLFLGEEEAARKNIEQALSRDGNFVPALFLFASLLDAEEEKKSRELESVVSRLEAAEAQPGWGSLYLKARRAVSEGLWPAAAEAYGALIRERSRCRGRYPGLDIEARLGRAVALLETGESLEAACQFAVIWDDHPEISEAAFLQGKAFYLLGHEEKADELLGVLFRRSEEDHEKDQIALSIAALYHQLGAYERGLEWADPIRDDYLRHRSRAILGVARGFGGESPVESGIRALLERPDDPPLYTYLRTGLLMIPVDKAVAFEPLMVRLAQKYPQSPYCLALRGNFECHRSNYEGGLSQFRRALKLDPENIEALVGLTHATANLNKTKERKRVIEQILAKVPATDRPDIERPWYARQNVRLRDERVDWAYRLCQIAEDSVITLNDYDEALELCRRALELDPRCVYALHVRGTILSKVGDYTGALRWYEKVLEIYPLGVTLKNKGNALRRLKRFEEALQAYEEALEVTPDDPRHTVGVLAVIREAEGEPRIRVLNRLLTVVRKMAESEVRPAGYARIVMLLARALVKESAVDGHQEKALECARLAVEVTERKDPAGLVTLARVLWLAGEVRQGMLLIEEAESLPGTGWRIEESLETARREVEPRLLTYASADAALRCLDHEVLIPKGAEWRFFRGLEEPPAQWIEPEFDDGAWELGPSGFGYEDRDDATVLKDMQGSYTSLYVRRTFSVPDPGAYREISLRVWADDGFVAYLNGKEVGRFRAPRGNPVPVNAVASEAAKEPLNPQSFRCEPSLFKTGENILAIQGLNHSLESSDFSLIPVLGAVVEELDPERDRKLLEDSSAAVKDDNDRRIVAYLEARLRQRAGRRDEAASLLAQLATEQERRPEPHLRYAESLRATGRTALAFDHLLRALGAGIVPDRVLWNRWLVIGLNDLERQPKDLLRELPGVPAAAPGPSYGEDVRWLLETLAAGKTIRINCGGGEFQPAHGEVWGRDRFFVGGSLNGGGDGVFLGEIADTDEDALYQTERWFRHGTVRPAQYQIPLPGKLYKVALHFAEIWHHDRGRRRFHVDLEGDRVLPDCEPLQKGFAAAEVYEFEKPVRDGILDITFSHVVGSPKISAIEVEPLE